MQVRLRAVRTSDLAVFFEHQCDAGAADMVGFVPRARAAFDDHWRTIIAGPTFIGRTVEADGDVAGYVTVFPRDGRSEIAYWLGREHWRKGISRQAVARFLAIHGERPVFASVATGNVASRAILSGCGFLLVAEDHGPDGRREDILRLD